MNIELKDYKHILKKVYNIFKINLILFFLFMFNPQNYYKLFLLEFKMSNVLRYTFKMILYSFIIFNIYIFSIMGVLSYAFNKNIFDNLNKVVFNNTGNILVFLIIFVFCLFYLFIFNISFKWKGKVVRTIISSLIINFYPALFFSTGIFLVIFYDYYKFSNFIIISIIIGIMISDAIKYLINMNTYNRSNENLKYTTQYNKYRNNINKLTKFLLIGGVISYVVISILNIFNVIISSKDFKSLQILVLVVIFISIFLIRGFMDVLYTFCICILILILNISNISYDIIYRNLSVILNSTHNPLKLGRFNVIYRLLKCIEKNSYDNALEISLKIIQIGTNKLTGIKFLSNELNNKNIDIDLLIKSIYKYGISNQNFEELLEILDEKYNSIFEHIYNMDKISKLGSEEELVSHLRNTQFFIKKTSKNTQYEKLLQCYIELLKINKIEMFTSLRIINTQYSIFNFHSNISDQLINISIINEEYLNSQISKESRLMSLNKIRNILLSLKEKIKNNENYPSRFILLTILSNYLDITRREAYYFKKRASIDLKILSNKVYYARKDKVCIPFLISNRGYGNANELVISIRINSININSEVRKYKIDKLTVDQDKLFDINIKINESGPINLFASVSYYGQNIGNYKEVFKFSILAESDGKTYKPVEDNFITGMVVHDETKFIGRKDYIKVLRDNINTTSIIIQGNRRIGKTSLLYRIKNGILGKGVYSIFFDMQQISIYDDSLDFLKYLIDKICIYMYEKGFKLDIIYNRDNDLKYQEILAILENVNNLLNNKILVLLFDEFEYFEKFINNSDIHFKSLWRSILINYSNIRFIFSGFLNLSKYSYWSEIDMVAKSIQLDKFTLLETKNLYEVYLKDNVIIEDAALNKIYESTGGHPYLLQCIGSDIVNYVNSMKEPYVLLEDVDEIKKKFLIRDNSFFKWLWYSLMNDVERNEIIIILNNNDPREPIIRLDNNINKINLNSLFTEKQIITIYDNKIDFSIPLFKEWIKMYIIT